MSKMCITFRTMYLCPFHKIWIINWFTNNFFRDWSIKRRPTWSWVIFCFTWKKKCITTNTNIFTNILFIPICSRICWLSHMLLCYSKLFICQMFNIFTHFIFAKKNYLIITFIINLEQYKFVFYDLSNFLIKITLVIKVIQHNVPKIYAI